MSVFSFGDPTVNTTITEILGEEIADKTQLVRKEEVAQEAIAVQLIDPTTFRDIVNTIYTYYVTYGKKPTLREIQERVPYSEAEVTGIVKTEQFFAAMKSRGIPWKEKKGLSTEQHLCIAFLTNPTDRRPVDKKLRACGVTYNQYRAWMQEPLFAGTLETLSNKMIQDNMVHVDRALLQQAFKGNMSAIEFLYKMTGKYDPVNQNQLEVNAVLNQVVEIITQNVKDPDTLEAIGQSLASLADKAGLRPNNSNHKAIKGETL